MGKSKVEKNKRKKTKKKISHKKMVLTPRQREELKSAVAAFLKEIGANEARKVFIEESDVKNVDDKKYDGLLEKKRTRPSGSPGDPNGLLCTDTEWASQGYYFTHS